LSENPLLPHRKLQELLRLTERCSKLEKKQRGGREAVLAATTIHLLPGDLLLSAPDDASAEALAPLSKASVTDDFFPSRATSRLLLGAATARGFRHAGTDNIVLALATANSIEPAWEEALDFAQTERLPFVFWCTDRQTAPSRKKGALTWTSLSSTCRGLEMPTVSVDGDDAVAVFRVMQECTLRARTGLGPAAVWSVLGHGTTKFSPLTRLKRYMAARNIPLAG